jgi:hypothetical protein
MTKTYYVKVEKTEYSSINLEVNAVSEEAAKVKAINLAKDWNSPYKDDWEEEGDGFVVQYVEEND